MYFILFLILGKIESTLLKEYRSDYEYYKKTDAFYKFHIESMPYDRADKVCKSEGSRLMTTVTDEDIVKVHSLFKIYPDIGDKAWIGSDEYDKSREEINEEENRASVDSNTCNVIKREGKTRLYKLCSNELPFVCKVDAEDAFHNSDCLVYGRGYHYYSSVRSCYKIPRIAFSWNQAFSYCKAEGAHLAIINSELERKVVQTLTLSTDPVDKSNTPWFYFVGIRAKKPVSGSSAVFKTIFNQTLEEAGFNQWCPNEPNNASGDQYCGTILKLDGKYNDEDCTTFYGFICEKEIPDN